MYKILLQINFFLIILSFFQLKSDASPRFVKHDGQLLNYWIHNGVNGQKTHDLYFSLQTNLKLHARIDFRTKDSYRMAEINLNVFDVMSSSCPRLEIITTTYHSPMIELYYYPAEKKCYRSLDVIRDQLPLGFFEHKDSDELEVFYPYEQQFIFYFGDGGATSYMFRLADTILNSSKYRFTNGQTLRVGVPELDVPPPIVRAASPTQTSPRSPRLSPIPSHVASGFNGDHVGNLLRPRASSNSGSPLQSGTSPQ